jgi:hypothetical protein
MISSIARVFFIAKKQTQLRSGLRASSLREATVTDEIVTDLISAIVAARADCDGVLTIAAVRARLVAAKLHVERVEDEVLEAINLTGGQHD